MSTVKADNFTWKTGEATAQVGSSVTGPQIVYGLTKAWITMQGTTPYPTRASFNFSSASRTAGGDYTFTFTTAMRDNYYSIAGSAGNGADGTQTGSIAPWNVDPSTTSFRVGAVYDGVTAYDNKWISVQVQR